MKRNVRMTAAMAMMMGMMGGAPIDGPIRKLAAVYRVAC